MVNNIQYASYNMNYALINNNKVTLPSKIQKMILYRDIIILMLDIEKEVRDLDINRSIFAIDKDGNILWQIEPSMIKDTCYANVYITENVQLKCNDFSGHTFDLDHETGKISNPVFTK